MSTTEESTLERAGSIQTSKVRDLKPLSRKQMLRAAERLPQALVKVTSYASGLSWVAATANYIARDGELPMETGEGDVLTSKEEVLENLNEWRHDFGERTNSRDSMHLILSTPKGSDRIATHRAIRTFAAEMFSANHSYMFAIHNDTEHPHGHVLVKMRGHDGQKLDPRKRDLALWRERFAEKCQAQGIAVDASPRLARGVGNKGKRLPVFKMAERNAELSVKSGFIESVKSAVEALAESGGITLTAWEKRAKKITAAFKAQYLAEVKLIEREAEDTSGEAKELLEAQATKLSAFAESLPEPRSLREQAVQHIQNAREAGRSQDVER